MMKKAFVTAAALAMLAGPAIAGTFDEDAKMIQDTAASAQISDADKAKVMELTAVAKQQNDAGQADQAAATLNQAKQLLGIN
ncbi:MAG: hypothetical protein HKN05_19220 [Rhizobiales bacterium]|nr:hypothetical protein [Hyphomicrobiales bacterium]